MVINEDFIVYNIRGLKSGLELGCGYGDLLLKLLKMGFNIYGIDICGYCVDSANRIFRDHGFGERCYEMYAESLLFKDSIFDFIYVVISLHEMDLEKVARESYRVLKHKGLFIDIDWAPWADTGVYERYLSIDEVRKIFEDSGFIVREAFYDGDLEYILLEKL